MRHPDPHCYHFHLLPRHFHLHFSLGQGPLPPSDILLPQVHGSWRKTVLFRSVLSTPLSDKLPEDRRYSETSGRSHHTHGELLQIPNSMLKVPVLSGWSHNDPWSACHWHNASLPDFYMLRNAEYPAYMVQPSGIYSARSGSLWSPLILLSKALWRLFSDRWQASSRKAPAQCGAFHPDWSWTVWSIRSEVLQG